MSNQYPPPPGQPPQYPGAPPPGPQYPGAPPPGPQYPGMPQAPQAPGAPGAAAPAARWWGGYVSFAMLAISLLLGIGTGIAAFQSEELGVYMSYVAIGPFAFGVAGTIVALVTKKNANPKIAVGAPIGCGCLAWLVAVALLVVFMVAIFPSL